MNLIFSICFIFFSVLAFADDQNRYDFIQAIRDFKEQHQVKLSELFNFDHPEAERFKPLRRNFFSVEAIRDYLSRSSESVYFQGNSPLLNVDPENKLKNDYYEMRIYTLIENCIPYRRFIGTDDFYVFGSPAFVSTIVAGNWNDEQVHVIAGNDIYKVRNFINQINNNFYPPNIDLTKDQIILFPMAKDFHATTAAAIYIAELKKVTVTIFINSINDSAYYNYLYERFNSLERNKVIIPMIDASHNIQIAEDDGNCALYSINFTQGIKRMISDCQKSTDLFALGKQVHHENCDKEVVAKLRIFFQEELRQYVGEYYHQNGHPRPMQEIKDGHIRQRWDLGSAFVKDLSLLSSTGIFDAPAFLY